MIDLSHEDCKTKYNEFGIIDPYPEIDPALLNSADIFDYVTKTGMINPFYEENLKPASYGIRLKGEYIYWESTTKKKSGKLERLLDKDEDGDTVFTLKRNSIAYLQLEPYFRFPYYIAARFNLKIKHIYQGILLGTGPLVDPGYEGNIFFPLHNLTNNDYKIKIDKPIIWMEFTKLSGYETWNSKYAKTENRKGKYVPFDKTRLNEKKTLSEYINDAHPNAPVISTISGFFEDTNKKLNDFQQKISKSETDIKNTTDSANRATTQFNRAIIISVIAVCVTLLITIYQTINIHYKTIDYLKDYDKRQADDYLKIIDQKNNELELKKQIFDLNSKLQEQQKQIDKLNRK